MKKFGAILRETREQRGLKGYELAKKVGINPVYITQIEKHDKFPSPLIMKKIADVLKDKYLFEAYLKIKYPILHEQFMKEGRDLAGESNELADEIVRTRDNRTSERHEELRKRMKNLLSKTRESIDKYKKILVMLEDIEKKHYAEPR